jgi:hypothetical protein
MLLVSLLLSAAPIAFPPATPATFPESYAAACTTDGTTRVCKAVPRGEGERPGLVVDGADERHVEWDATALSAELDDFQVLKVDLDEDARDELLIANRAAEVPGVPVRLWELTIVDGATDEVTHALVHDWGSDALDAQGRLLLTEWDWHDREVGLVFVGREYTYNDGRLWPTKSVVLKRKLDSEFAAERAAVPGLLLTPRRFLAHKSTAHTSDTVAKKTAHATVLGLSREDPFLGLHVQRDDGTLESLSELPDAKPLLRLGDLRTARLYPMGYAPAGAEDWLVGRRVRLVLDGTQASGPVWID